MTENSLSANSSEIIATPPDLRVVLLADAKSLRCYGPVLRRMTVGLFDEVGDLSVVCLDHSPLLDYVPSPPIRLIRQTRRYSESADKYDTISREVTISAPRLDWIDRLLPYRQAERIANVLTAYKPSLLHALSENQLKLTQWLSRKLEIPYLVSLLSLQNETMEQIDRNCGKILPCNTHLARWARQARPDLSSRIQRLPIGTYVSDKYCCYSKDRLQTHIFCCGRLMLNIGLEELINACKTLKDKGDTFVLTISGEGPAEWDLRKQVKKLGLSKTITFAPPIDAMLQTNDSFKVVLRAFDIFVQPWPVTTWRPELLESMSVGNAVIAAEGADNDLIIKNRTALTVPVHDEAALTAAMHKLISDRDFARKLAAGSQEFLRKHFLVSRMISRLAKAYKEAYQIKLIKSPT